MTCVAGRPFRSWSCAPWWQQRASCGGCHGWTQMRCSLYLIFLPVCVHFVMMLDSVVGVRLLHSHASSQHFIRLWLHLLRIHLAFSNASPPRGGKSNCRCLCRRAACSGCTTSPSSRWRRCCGCGRSRLGSSRTARSSMTSASASATKPACCPAAASSRSVSSDADTDLDAPTVA